MESNEKWILWLLSLHWMVWLSLRHIDLKLFWNENLFFLINRSSLTPVDWLNNMFHPELLQPNQLWSSNTVNPLIINDSDNACYFMNANERQLTIKSKNNNDDELIIIIWQINKMYYSMLTTDINIYSSRKCHDFSIFIFIDLTNTKSQNDWLAFKILLRKDENNRFNLRFPLDWCVVTPVII